LNTSEKILITGAYGQLGRDVALAARAAGRAVMCYGREDLDITDKGAVFSVMEKEAPGIIINAAAYTKVDLAEKERERAFQVNCEGARNLALASSATGAALIHISTDFVFDGRGTSPYKEEDETAPIGVYGQSKLAGEEAIRAACERHIIIRTSWLYGVHGANFVKTILRLAGERDILKVVNDQRGSPTWTMDIAGAIMKITEALKKGAPPLFGLYHYSDDGAVSWFDFALAIVEEARELGMELKCRELEPIPTSAYPTPTARPAYSVLGTTKIKKTFNLSIPLWRDSLKAMLSDLKKGAEKNG